VMAITSGSTQTEMSYNEMFKLMAPVRVGRRLA
jgi:hypothetical protein